MKTFLLVILLNSIFLAQTRWEKLNGPMGGDIQALISKGDTLIAGTGYDHAIIFYSTNRGENWKRANIKVTKGIISFAFSNDNGVIASAMFNGIYKSFDLITWYNIYSDGNRFGYLGTDFQNNLYTGTINNNVTIPDKIFISTDNGVNWEISFNNYYSNFGNFLSFDDSTLFIGGNKEILKKEPGSNIWMSISLDTIYSAEYKIFSDISGNIYAFNVGTEMIMSPDSGNTWKFLDTLGFLKFGNQMGACIFNNRLIGGMSWTGLHYALGVVVSDDNGYTWRESNFGLPPRITYVTSLAKSGNITYLGTTAAGVFKSTDYGDSWSPLNNGLTAAHTRDICFDPDGTLYTANWSNGFQKSTDNGVSWNVINNGLTNVGSYSIVADDNGNLIGGTDEGILRSTDEGEHWTKTNTAGNDFGYALHKDHLNRIYVQTYGSGVYRTTNLGESWQRIDNFASGYTFGLTSDSTGLMLAGTAGGRIYRSTNYGASWSPVYHNSIFNSVIGDITPIYGDYVYATNHFAGILRSSNKGISWELVKPDTGYLFTYPALLTSEGVYAAGSGDKLYFSSDNGNSWNDVTDNLALTSFFKLREYKNRIYFATDESVWRSSIFTTAINNGQNSITDYQLSQNYPNPFNPTTTIEFSLPKEENVKLSLYSILGEELRVLVNEKMTAGIHKYTLDASALPSGVYIYRLRSGGFSDTKKIVVLK